MSRPYICHLTNPDDVRANHRIKLTTHPQSGM